MEQHLKLDHSHHPFDLEKRTTEFGIAVIALVKTIPQSQITRPLLGQLIRSGTSIGANYMEANAAESKRDFKHIIARCKKEAKETGYWLHMLGTLLPNQVQELRNLWKEADELTRIFSAILIKNNDIDR